MNRTIKAISVAALTVIAIYFLATVFGKIGSSWRVFLPLDILLYFAIGFYSARSLRSWSGGLAVAAVAALVDVALAVGSLILPEAPRMGLMEIVKAEALDFGLNAFVGLAGSIVGARTVARAR